MSPADKPVRVGMLGCGVVGSQVARLLLEDTAELSTRAGVKIELTRIAVRTIKDYPGLDPKLFTTDPFSIVNDPDIDLIVEVMGGIEPARELIMTAIENRKSVVTANKALLASHGAEMFTAAYAKGEDIYYEASVAGAVPIIRPMRDSLAGDFVTRLMGIVNGTTNYILTKMHEDNREFEDVLKEAQALGYAELNRHLDGKCTLDQAVGDIVTHTRQFAVRQERWFRRDPRIRWVHIEKDPVTEIATILAEHLR